MVAKPKLTETIRFRATAAQAERLEKLSARARWEPSALLREAIDAFWPEIEAHILSQSGRQVTISPALARKIREAQNLGVDLEALILSALLKKQ